LKLSLFSASISLYDSPLYAGIEIRNHRLVLLTLRSSPLYAEVETLLRLSVTLPFLFPIYVGVEIRMDPIIGMFYCLPIYVGIETAEELNLSKFD
jgi:hypothetical protein